MNNELPELPEDMRQAIAAMSPSLREFTQLEEMIHAYARAAVKQAGGESNSREDSIVALLEEAIKESKP
jgi:hypothetical protein